MNLSGKTFTNPDFERRIQEANEYADQTYNTWQQYKRESGQAMDVYNNLFNQNNTYQSIYDQAKRDHFDQAELDEKKSILDKSKEMVDQANTYLDKLPETVGQQFGGTGLTEAQRQKATASQRSLLQKQFKQYDAGYQFKFADYNKAVDDAFNRVLSVADKTYESVWDGIRRKFNDWQDKVNESNFYSDQYWVAKSAVSSVQNQYSMWKTQQDIMEYKRQQTIWWNNYYAESRARMDKIARDAADRRVKLVEQEKLRQERWDTDVTAFQTGKLSAAEFIRRMDAGTYR